ncbi:hypothetical protein Tco_0485460 [Tanacetum coccineum]
MEAAIDQCYVDNNALEIKIKQLRIDNDQLLNQIMSKEIVHIAMNSVDILDVSKSCVDECNKCLSQEKDTAIRKLKDKIKSLSGKDSVENVKKDIDEIETTNIELEHKHSDSLIAQLNSKSMENAYLKGQIQEKVFANATLNNELRKLKGKNAINTAVSKPKATTIAPGMFKIKLEPLAPKLLKNKDTHIDYIKHSREHADMLWKIVENARALSPLDNNLDSASKYVQRIQKVLVYVQDTCPCLTKPKERLVAVTPQNKDKKVRLADLVTSLSNTQKQVDTHKTHYSNPPLLHSTGLICSTGSSGSNPTGNTKNNMISQ